MGHAYLTTQHLLLESQFYFQFQLPVNAGPESKPYVETITEFLSSNLRASGQLICEWPISLHACQRNKIFKQLFRIRY